MTGLVCLLVAMNQDQDVDLWKVVDAAWTRIESDYYDSKSGLYKEFWSSEEKLDDTAFNWTVGIAISALNGLAKHSPERKARLAGYLEKVATYWNERGPVAGFDVIPHPPGVDRYYDDNAWMVLSLLESAEVTGDSRWKDRAELALKYVLSGEDEKLGGGIYWRESDKASKNTCSNSPSAVACFEMFKATGKTEYRDAGYRALDWVMENMYDSSDHLMWDNMNLKGEVEKTKWSYNTALTVQALKFAESEGDRKYPVSSKEMFEAAWKKWHVGGGKLSGPGKFSHLLFEVGVECGFLTPAQIREVASATASLVSGERKRWGGTLDRVARADRERFELIDEASAVRVLVVAGRVLVGS